MKLDKNKFFSKAGEMRITDEGWLDLQNFCKAIIYKNVGTQYPTEDLISDAIIACVNKLPDYNPNKNNQLGGYLYWPVRGVISMNAHHAKKEIPWGFFNE